MPQVSDSVLTEVEEYLKDGIFRDKGKDESSEDFMGFNGAMECFKRGDHSQAIRCLAEDIHASELAIYQFENMPESDDADVGEYLKEDENLRSLMRMHKALLS